MNGNRNQFFPGVPNAERQAQPKARTSSRRTTLLASPRRALPFSRAVASARANPPGPRARRPHSDAPPPTLPWGGGGRWGPTPMASAGNSGGGDDDSGGKLLVDRYLKGEQLGEGTYGVVNKAIDTKVPFLHPFFLNPYHADLRAAASRELDASGLGSSAGVIGIWTAELVSCGLRVGASSLIGSGGSTANCDFGLMRIQLVIRCSVQLCVI